MRKGELEHFLTQKLRLKQPIFQLRTLDSRLVGNVISDTFKGMSSRQRLDKVWGVLNAEFGAASVEKIGSLLMYTQDEWNTDIPNLSKTKTPNAAKHGRLGARLRSSKSATA